MHNAEVIIIGAGASGLMCAIEAGRRGRRVLVLDASRKPGNKIRMSGGGRCNFTNYDVGPGHYLCANPHFVKSALSRFTQWDFIAMVSRYEIPWHEREHGQLFCDDSAKAILDMLLAECRAVGVTLQYRTAIDKVTRLPEGSFSLRTSEGDYLCHSLVIASGGLSIPTMGASPFGYRIAEQFGIPVRPTRPGLVPLLYRPEDKAQLAALTGIAVEAVVSCADTAFRENVLFTHRGLSGPAILQISNYWEAGQVIRIDWLPDLELFGSLKQAQREHPRRQLKTVLGQHLPQRLVAALVEADLLERPLAEIGNKALQAVDAQLKQWTFRPAGTEGYRTAEVTLGGVDTDAVSSKTFEAKAVPGLYFIGEVLDVTGWLGGYNFQWAWASGWCAGQYV